MATFACNLERLRDIPLSPPSIEKMEGDAKALLEISALVVASMTYARFASSSIASGRLRLLSLLPVVVLLPFLPWRLSSIHLRATSFFFLVWLAVFKLLLLSFGLGPLSPSLSLLAFLTVSSLPVNLRSPNSPPSSSSVRLFLASLINAIQLSLIIHLYQYESLLHNSVLTVIYCIHVYLDLEFVLSCSAFLVRFLLRLDLEPHFVAPYKSNSLQDFWGRRWNLTVTGILRPSVYHPVSTKWGPDAGVMASFLVSGLMHELMFWYITLVGPTGEVSCFFILNGICTVVEGMGRRKGWWRPHRAVAEPLAVGFVAVTGYWLFFPPLLRAGSDRVMLQECTTSIQFLEDAVRSFMNRVNLAYGSIFNPST